MAKIKHNNFLDTVDTYFSQAKKKRILHLHAEDTSFSGRFITINTLEFYHFGTTGYLGLEQDQRLKDAAIDAIQRYGTQFPLSKTYISHPLYASLENELEQLFNAPVIITKNSTLGHLGVIPGLVKDQDAVILDHQVHWSVHNAIQLLKPRGISVNMIPHNDLTALEDLIRELKGKHDKIWFFADGVYSMFGDYAPVQDLLVLLDIYPQLHLYFDDVHGMSWTGIHGSGYVLSQCRRLGFDRLPERVMLMATLSKTFGANGSVFVCSNKKIHRKLKLYGGPLTFSAQLDPASVATAIASAKIHRSEEILILQNELKEKIVFCNDLLKTQELPVIAYNETPVFYIPCGLPVTGYEMFRHLYLHGIYANLGLFPAVPLKNTGIRFTISRHNEKEDIERLVNGLSKAFEKTLLSSDSSREQISDLFGNPDWGPGYANRILQEHKEKRSSNLKMECYNTITKLDQKEWKDSMFPGLYDYQGQQWLEESLAKVYTDEHGITHRTKFYYFRVTDAAGDLVLLCFFSLSLQKDDMLAPESVSKTFEQKRLKAPTYMTSNVMSMGSTFTEGQHFHAEHLHPEINNAWKLVFRQVEVLNKENHVEMTMLRDFYNEGAFQGVFQNQGFIQISMPKSCKLCFMQPTTKEEWFSSLSKRNRRHFRTEIEPYLELCTLSINQEVSKARIEEYYVMYQNVQKQNLGINMFPWPKQLFLDMNINAGWEFLELCTKDQESKCVGVIFCYYSTSNFTYTPALIGFDYTYNTTYAVYRQLLYYSILRGLEKNAPIIDLGFSAAFEKKKLGAELWDTYAYLQSNDNFKLDMLELTKNES
ncbi:aminotransferase class I/II-fold pyridoxal phosphate-dependent enzyme [Zunongwangia atlantica]|uniref:Class-I/II aminotransferase n=1 Tax=Zunongwangia atlantica 22II14-10F7 TaxID=1185767 RepID=A0A1Y1T017_9FLAO|nr:aminotransferase class I/II-fold pyridoxal phosphate-dependent enzyme [Zunongwangia atlantica]ORL43843.1 class-I/II aminotransferase [Zunongwangia atlantica 22II14-10F7]